MSPGAQPTTHLDCGDRCPSHCRGVQKNRVKLPAVGPLGRVGGDHIGLQSHALQIGLNPLEARSRAVKRDHLGAGRGHLQGLAPRGGAEVQGSLPGLKIKQAHRHGGAGVLDPPGAFCKPWPGRDLAAQGRAPGAARQNLDLKCGVGLGAGVPGAQVCGRFGGDFTGHGQGGLATIGGLPACKQPGRGKGFGISEIRRLAGEAAQDGIDQALEIPGRSRSRPPGLRSH